MLTLQELIEESWRTAEEKGWHSLGKSVGEEIALMHSELSEALEEHRAGHAASEIYFRDDGKPEGIPVELADVLIRVADFCQTHGVPLETALRVKARFNATRPHLHGGKRL